MVCSSALSLYTLYEYELHVLRPLQTYRIFERDMLEDGSKWTGTTPPHLVTKNQKIVVKGQGDPADHQILTEGSALNAVYKIAAEHTFAALLTTKETARVLSTSKKREKLETRRAPGQVVTPSQQNPS